MESAALIIVGFFLGYVARVILEHFTLPQRAEARVSQPSAPRILKPFTTKAKHAPKVNDDQKAFNMEAGRG